jgi:hypothetical protein
VTHITLSKVANSKPCLEYFSDGSGEARRVTIEQYPFRIGRSETADLRVESVEVSREHAEIIERNGMWLVRDLGSTNGTHVNGNLIKETLLSDGDILKVAETELTFIASAASQFQRMVTQPLYSKKNIAAPFALPPEVASTRMIAEATLWQVIPTQLLAVTSLRHRVIEAFFSQAIVEARHQVVDGTAERCCVAEQRGDVPERDTRRRVVRDRSDVFADPGRVGCHDLRLPIDDHRPARCPTVPSVRQRRVFLRGRGG